MCVSGLQARGRGLRAWRLSTVIDRWALRCIPCLQDANHSHWPSIDPSIIKPRLTRNALQQGRGGLGGSTGVSVIGEANHARRGVRPQVWTYQQPRGILLGKRTSPWIYISVAMEQSACLAPVWLSVYSHFHNRPLKPSPISQLSRARVCVTSAQERVCRNAQLAISCSCVSIPLSADKENGTRHALCPQFFDSCVMRNRHSCTCASEWGGECVRACLCVCVRLSVCARIQTHALCTHVSALTCTSLSIGLRHVSNPGLRTVSDGAQSRSFRFRGSQYDWLMDRFSMSHTK